MNSTSQHQDASLLWPTVGTVVFVAVVPGTVIGIVPYLLSGWHLQPPLLRLTALRGLGGVVFLCGLPIFFDFLIRFVRDGHGTPAPIAPPRQLVVTGAFRYVRNPGYIGVLALVVGQGLFFGSAAVLWYAVGLGLAFHAFVLLYEEPTLRRQFGAQYDAYCGRVHRWVPRRPE